MCDQMFVIGRGVRGGKMDINTTLPISPPFSQDGVLRSSSSCCVSLWLWLVWLGCGFIGRGGCWMLAGEGGWGLLFIIPSFIR